MASPFYTKLHTNQNAAALCVKCMRKLIALLFIFTMTSRSYGDRPFYEEIDVERLPDLSERIAVVEIVSGQYVRDTDKYKVKLKVVHSIKGKSTPDYKISHQYGWNRLEQLGGYYLIFLGKDSRLMETGSAIVPLIGYGGPFSDASLSEAAVTYKLPEGAWFTLGDKLWGLKNCIWSVTLTCDREKLLIKNTFNKSSKKDAASGASS